MERSRALWSLTIEDAVAYCAVPRRPTLPAWCGGLLRPRQSLDCGTLSGALSTRSTMTGGEVLLAKRKKVGRA